MVTKARTGALIGLLAFLSALVALSIDIYLPSIPAMVRYFSTTPDKIQLTLTLFFIFCGIGQLFSGFISDCVGRRKVLLVGLWVYTMGSVVCMFASNVNLLIVGRVIQALGASSAVVVAPSVVRDLYSGQDSARAYAYVMLAISFSPAIAPTIGGYLGAYFGWRSIFIFLTVLGVLLSAVAYYFLYETLTVENRHQFYLMQLFKSYKAVLFNRSYQVYASCSVIIMMGLMAFITGSAYLFIDKLHVQEQNFGLYFALEALVLMIGSLLATRIVRYISIDTLLIAGASFMVVGAVVMLFLSQLTPWSAAGALAISIFGLALSMPASMSGLMQPFQKSAGTAAALTGFLRFIMAAAISVIMGVTVANISITIPVVILCSGMLCIVIIAVKMYRLGQHQ